ncbi:hypothetical protein HKD37_02G005427 [Glycine soja]
MSGTYDQDGGYGGAASAGYGHGGRGGGGFGGRGGDRGGRSGGRGGGSGRDGDWRCPNPRIKQKRGYKDQWPWNIKLYTDEKGNNKGDGCLVYEDPSAAHSAGSFYNNYDLRGYKIGVAMAEKSAPKAPPAYNHGGNRSGYGGDRRRDNYRDGGSSGPDRRDNYGGNRSRPY